DRLGGFASGLGRKAQGVQSGHQQQRAQTGADDPRCRNLARAGGAVHEFHGINTRLTNLVPRAGACRYPGSGPNAAPRCPSFWGLAISKMRVAAPAAMSTVSRSVRPSRSISSAEAPLTCPKLMLPTGFLRCT